MVRHSLGSQKRATITANKRLANLSSAEDRCRSGHEELKTCTILSVSLGTALAENGTLVAPFVLLTRNRLASWYSRALDKGILQGSKTFL